MSVLANGTVLVPGYPNPVLLSINNTVPGTVLYVGTFNEYVASTPSTMYLYRILVSM